MKTRVITTNTNGIVSVETLGTEVSAGELVEELEALVM